MPILSAISRLPQRWIVCALCSLALAIAGYKNYCFDAIAAIVDSTTETKKIPRGGCPYFFSGTSWERRKLALELPDFFWDPNVMDEAESAFFAGKILMVLPAGVLSDLGYSRYVLGCGMSLVASCYLLLPLYVRSESTVYIIENLFEGIGEALIYPSIFTLISHWAFPSERNLFTVLVVVGLFYGDTLGHIFFNIIYLELKSWKAGNFTMGIIGIIWLVLGFIFIYHSPDESPFVQRQLYRHGSSFHRRRTLTLGLIRLQGIPWRKIVASRPFLSLILAFCSVNWFAYLNIFHSFNTYEQNILHLPERFSNESSVMVIAVVPLSLLAGLLADWVNKRELMSKTNVKKVFTFIGVFFASLLQVISVLVGCNIMLFWVLSVLAVYILGLANPVIYSAPIDLSPRHAGMLMAVMTAIRTIFAIFKGKVGEIIITDEYNSDQWRLRYILYSVITFTGIIPFLFFGSGETQNWRIPRHGTTIRHTSPSTPPATPEGQSLQPITPTPDQSVPRSRSRFAIDFLQYPEKP